MGTRKRPSTKTILSMVPSQMTPPLKQTSTKLAGDGRKVCSFVLQTSLLAFLVIAEGQSSMSQRFPGMSGCLPQGNRKSGPGGTPVSPTRLRTAFYQHAMLRPPLLLHRGCAAFACSASPPGGSLRCIACTSSILFLRPQNQSRSVESQRTTRL